MKKYLLLATMLSVFTLPVLMVHAKSDYKYLPNFYEMQDDVCKNTSASKLNFYVSYQKIEANIEISNFRPTEAIAFFLNFTTNVENARGFKIDMMPQEIICKTVPAKIRFNKKTNAIEIYALDSTRAFNWNEHRLDGDFAKNAIKESISSKIEIIDLPLYQILKVTLMTGSNSENVLLYNDPRNFELYVFEDVMSYFTNRRAPESQANILVRDFNDFARGTDEESLFVQPTHRRSDGAEIEVKTNLE